MVSEPRHESRWNVHWWLRAGLVVTASLAALGLIALGAVRYLAQAQREHDRVDCVQREVAAEASGLAVMSAVVLDSHNDLTTRQRAFTDWAAQQSLIAARIGGC